jgi:glycosidase
MMKTYSDVTRTLRRILTALLVIPALVLMLNFSACKSTPATSKAAFEMQHLDWIYPATIYEVNVRQFTPEGTFAAFEEHLPRLKELGIEILWFMPIHPIGEEARKGTLGSYYSIKDYKGINPEFGNLDDFKRLVKKSHDLGMKVIIDWVANHSAHDIEIAKTNPEFYVKDSEGKFISPFDWSDVIKFDYSNPEMRKFMIDALEFWVRDIGIDGYRCDVAAEVPTDFWNDARAALDKIGPVFMLAEAEHKALLEFAFNAEYGWEQHHIMNEVAKGKKPVADFDKYFEKMITDYHKNSIKMNFTSNHDENSWNGTEFERMGDGVKTFAAFTFVIPGMPLLYNGQEVGFNRRLEFFEKDQIDWKDNGNFEDFYKKLIAMRRNNTALWAATKGADMERIPTPNNPTVYSFVRKNDKDKVLAIFNFGAEKVTFDLSNEILEGEYVNVLTGENKQLSGAETMTLNPWGFLVLEGKK